MRNDRPRHGSRLTATILKMIRKTFSGAIRIFTVIMVLFIATAASTAANPRLIDSDSGEPLALASISDRRGTLIATTGKTGEIPAISQGSFPVTFSYMGYEPLEVYRIENEDIRMKASAYVLPEIEISPESHPLLHITGYMREYSSALGTPDSVVVFKESIVDFLVPVEKTKNKGWRRPRELASKTYTRITGKGLDSVSNQADDIYLWAHIMQLFPEASAKLKMPETIAAKEGFATDTVTAKDKTTLIWHKKEGGVRLTQDVMTRFDNRVYTPGIFKLLGLTVDITEMSANYYFSSNRSAEFSPIDLNSLSLSLKMTGRGKGWKWAFDSKTPIGMTSYIEVYFTDREYLTEQDAKDLKKNPPQLSPSAVKAPVGATPLHPGILRIIDRADAMSVNK